MGVVKTPDIRPGMVLAEDLSSPQGRLLFTEGSQLTADRLRILKIWGVREANIHGIPNQHSSPLNPLEIEPELFNLSDEYVNSYLSNFDLEHEAMSEVYRLCLKRTAQHVAEGHDLPDQMFSCDGNAHAPGAGCLSNRKDPCFIAQQIHDATRFPETYSRINELLNSPRSTSSQVAATIATNASLSESLLKLVNSPLYAFPSPIEDIHQAVSILGADELNILILGLSVYDFFTFFLIPPDFHNRFWKHAILCGCISKLLAGLLPGVTIERFFVAGLLHDIGKLAIAVAAPSQNARIQNYALQQSLPVYKAERHILGYDHTQLGMKLLQDWMVPKALITITRFHHDPLQSELTLEPAIAHLADILALAIDTATINPSVLPPLAPGAWESLGFPTSILEPVITQAEQQAKAIYKIFLKETLAQ